MIEAGKPFEAAFLTGLTYLLLALALNLLHAVYEDFYLRWKKQEIEGTIERSIYEKALMVDYRHFDDPSYFDSYKLTTEKFASQSSETLQNLFSLLSGVAKCIVYGALIASQGVALLLIVLGCSAFVAYAQIYWSRVSVERETAMVNDQRKADYLRRLFFDHTAVADLRASNIKKPLFFAVRRLCEEQGRDLSKIRRKGIFDRYSGKPRAARHDVCRAGLCRMGRDVWQYRRHWRLCDADRLVARAQGGAQRARLVELAGRLRRCLRAEGAALFSTQIRPSKRRQTAKKRRTARFPSDSTMCPTATAAAMSLPSVI